MIQRKQTLFLLLAVVVMAVCAATAGIQYVWILAVLCSLGSLADVFLYNNRKLQARVCTGLIMLGVLYYIAVAVLFNVSGENTVLAWPMALPAVAIVAWFLAYKGIMHDEKLVRSLDRIR